MKRSAESQLTRETLESEDDSASDGPREFQRAPPKELAKRVIKPLPSRRGGSGSPAPTSAPALPTAQTNASSSTPGATTASTTAPPTLGPTKLPPLPTGAFTFKAPATQGSSPFAPPSSTGSSNKPSLPSFTGFGTSGSTAASATSGGGFSFKLPAPIVKDGLSESPSNGSKASASSSGALPPFNPSAISSTTSLPSFGTLPSGNAKLPTKPSAPSFSFGAPPSKPTQAAPISKPATSTAPKLLPTSKPPASVPNKAPAKSPNMTATAKSMSSIFSSMTSESPPRPSLPGFKGPNGGIAVSPEKGASSSGAKGKTGSFSFGGGIPKKTVPGDVQTKPKVDKGKGKATTSTGTFGLGKSYTPQSPVEEEVEDDQSPYSPTGPLPNGPSPNDPNGQYHELPGSMDAGDFDPALNDDGSPMRKPYYHTDHQEAHQNDPELKYWLHLRGLNTSFLREIIRMQREDAFIDMSGVFKSYKEFRKGIIGEMVEYLRANGKGDGTESGGEESDSEDEEMYYEEGEPEEVHMEGMEDEPPKAHAEQPKEQRSQSPEEDKEKTPPALPRGPKAPENGVYFFGGKPVSSSMPTSSTSGGGFRPTGALADFKLPTIQLGFKPSTTPAIGGFTPSIAQPSSQTASTKDQPKSGFTFKPTTTSTSASTLPPPTGPTLGFTPSITGTSSSSATAPSSGTSSGFGFTPSVGSSSAPSALAPSTGSGFGFTPSTTSTFSFGKPSTAALGPGAPKENESPPAKSTFPGFGPITGGASGSPFGAKSTGDSTASSSSSSAFSLQPSKPSAFGSGSMPTFGFGAGASGKSDSSAPPPTFGSTGAGAAGDAAKPSSAFGTKSSFSWPPSTPETVKPGGLFGAPPPSVSPIFGSGISPQPGSLFGTKPAANSGISLFGSGSTFGGAGSSAFGSGAPTSSPFGSGAPGSSAPPSGDPAKSSRDSGSQASQESGEGNDELEGDEDESTTPKAKPKDLPASELAPSTRVGIPNPWAKPTASIAPAPAPGGPFTFGMGSKPAAPETTPVKSTGFSFADPPSSFKLPSAGAFSFADPPKSAAGTSGGGFSFAEPPKSAAGVPSNAFTNPFASPPKTGTLFGFGAASSGFGGKPADAGTGTGVAAAPPLFGRTTSGGFSFGDQSAVPKFDLGSVPTSGSSGGFAGFGAPSAASSSAGTSHPPAIAGSSQDSDVAPETGLALGEDKFDQPGPGEEMEENMYNVRGKVLKFSDNKWLDLGIGQVRLYKHKETGAKRVFARNSKSGRILLNFAPFSKMEPKVDDQNPKFMRMTGMDDGKLIKILIKLKEKNDAAELVSVLQKEVEALS